MSRQQQYLLTCAALIGAVLLTFWPAINADFLEWDDDHNVYNNLHLRELSSENLQWMFFDVGRDTRYKALSWLGWTLIHQSFGLHAPAFHAANVLLHAINACLVLALCLRFLAVCRSVLGKTDEPPGTDLAIAGLATMFWALHPLRVEPVAWVTGFPYHVSLLFLLGSLLVYLGLDFAKPVFRQRRYWIMLGLYAAAMMSYPMPIGGVAIFAALNVFPLGRVSVSKLSDLLGQRNRRTLLELAPLVAISIAMLGVAIYGAHVRLGIFTKPPTLEELPLANRMMQAAYIWCYYLWKPLIPFHLSPVYQTFAGFKPTDIKFLLSAIALVGTTAWVFRRRSSEPGWTAFWLAHIGVLVPVLGVNVFGHVASDRYSIIHGLVLSLAMAYWLSHGLKQRNLRAAITVIGLTTVLFATLSWRQCHVWKNNRVFFTRQTENLPDGGARAAAFFRLGNEHFRANEFAAAISDFEASHQSFPGIRIPEMPFRHAESLFALGRYSEAEAQYLVALNLRQDAAEIWYGLGQSLLAQGRIDEVLPLFEESIRRFPDIAEFHDDLAKIHAHRGRQEKAAIHTEAARVIRFPRSEQ